MGNKNIDAINTVLASTYVLYFKTQVYHWNIEGSDFISLHDLFGKQYKDMYAAIDVIAERIRQLRGYIVSSLSDFEKKSVVDSSIVDVDTKSIIRDLYNDHNIMINLLRDTLKGIEEDYDYVSENILHERLVFHEKHLWILSSLIK